MEGRVVFTSFIPHELEVPDRPELRYFPQNVLIGDNLFEPWLTSHRGMPYRAEMFYFTQSDPNLRLAIVHGYNGNYAGRLYRGEELIRESTGPDWKTFFTHLTMTFPE